jgi:hypothetical protein
LQLNVKRVHFATIGITPRRGRVLAWCGLFLYFQ